MKNDTEQRTPRNAPASAATAAQPIRIMGFVDGDVIPAACYDEPYRLEPDKGDSRAYEVLREVMHRSRKVGLAAVTIERKQTLAAVIPIGRTLVLNVLRLATSLVPRARHADKVAAAGTNGPAKPRIAAVATAPATRRRMAPVASADAPKNVARIAPARRHGEVIDLAMRRSSKRAAQVRVSKVPRERPAPVATLHQLRRKGSAPRTPVKSQLA